MTNIPRTIYRLFFRTFFYLLYQPFAWAYDLVAGFVSLGNWKNWVTSTLPYLNGSILELGHGPGHLQAAILKKGLRTVGLDRSSQMSRLAKMQLQKITSLNSRIKPCLVTGDGMALPFAPSSFDTVAATFPTEYIVAEETLTGIHRVLRPEGRLVILPAAWITGKSLPERAMAWLFQVTGQSPPINTDIDKLLEPLRESGFEPAYQWLDMKGARLLLVVAERKKYSPEV